MGRKKKIFADSSLYYVDIDKNGKKVLKKKSWFKRLVDSNDTTVAASTVYMLIVAALGILLLVVPAIALLVEVCFNHTIMTDLSGMAAYIGAVSTLILQGGILKGWNNYSEYKYLGRKEPQQQEEVYYDMMEDENNDPEIDNI